MLRLKFAGGSHVQHAWSFTSAVSDVEFIHSELRQLTRVGQQIGFDVANDIIVSNPCQFQPGAPGAVG